MREYKGLPVISAITECERLVDLVEKVFERLPDVADECCSACGYTCTQLTERILAARLPVKIAGLPMGVLLAD